MTEVGEVIDKGQMTGIEEDIILLDPGPKDMILHEVPITGKTIITIKVTEGIPDLKVYPDLLPGSQELHLGY